jgi:CPA2 family monovalent cation:H+ antiporter-2
MENAGLLGTLAFALIAAGLGAVIAVRLGQSVMLGYLAAGLVIGPYTPGVVADTILVEELAEIGVVLLLFVVGVQLSLRDLTAVGPVAIVGGLSQVAIMIGVGYLAGLALGWDPVESLFLGAFVSNSSSTVISKVVGERGELSSLHARVGLAWSSVQDLSTIALVVILTSIAQAGGNNLAQDLGLSLAKAGAFTAVLLLGGPRVLPLVFERVALLHNREIFVFFAAAAATGTALLAGEAGMSPAIGAFLAGVVLNESDVWHEIEERLSSIRDLFAGLFFVSVGMLIDPESVAGHLPAIVVGVLLIVAVKGALSVAIARLFRYPMRTAFLAGVVLAQSAEFSVILARAGTEVDALGEGVPDAMLSAAVVSIMIAAPLLRWMEPVARALHERFPPGSEPGERPTYDGGAMRGHAVVCGYGRVGRVIAELLRARNLPYVIIEEDRRVVEDARREGEPILLGSASNPRLLEWANVENAFVLAIAIPDAFAARQAMEQALRINPSLNVVVRTDNDVEQVEFEALGAREAVLGERELAFEMSRFVLNQFGVETIAQQVAINRMRRRRPTGPELT